MENDEGRTSSEQGTLGPRDGRSTRPPAGTPARILALLRARPEPLPQAAIVAATGRHENTVREHLDRLVRQGLVARTDRKSVV